MNNKNLLMLQWSFLLLLPLISLAGCRTASPPLNEPESRTDPIEGSWRPTTYRLESGEAHNVDGSIFFADGRWVVLFYVLDEQGKPTRGAAEGGTYTTSGEELTFSHLYNLSSGEAGDQGEPASLRMVLRAEGQGVPEECTYQIDGNRLTIYFPSGNTMEFTRF